MQFGFFNRIHQNFTSKFRILQKIFKQPLTFEELEQQGLDTKNAIEVTTAAYQRVGVLTHKQRLTLFHGIVTFLCWHIKPQVMFEKTVQSVTVYAVVRLIAEMSETQHVTAHLQSPYTDSRGKRPVHC